MNIIISKMYPLEQWLAVTVTHNYCSTVMSPLCHYCILETESWVPNDYPAPEVYHYHNESKLYFFYILVYILGHYSFPWSLISHDLDPLSMPSLSRQRFSPNFRKPPTLRCSSEQLQCQVRWMWYWPGMAGSDCLEVKLYHVNASWKMNRFRGIENENVTVQ
jgi:hypothetical protein